MHGRKIVIETMSTFQALSGLPAFEFVFRSRYIEFAEQAAVGPEDFDSLIEANCFAVPSNIRQPPNQNISLAVIPLYLQQSNMKGCVRHELFHVFGFPGHTESEISSVMSANTGRSVFSINDLIMLRTLYDSRINSSMSRRNVMLVAPKIIAELLEALEGVDDPMEALFPAVAS